MMLRDFKRVLIFSAISHFSVKRTGLTFLFPSTRKNDIYTIRCFCLWTDRRQRVRMRTVNPQSDNEIMLSEVYIVISVILYN